MTGFLTRNNRRVLAGTLAAGALLWTACGSSGPSTASSGHEVTTTAVAPGAGHPPTATTLPGPFFTKSGSGSDARIPLNVTGSASWKLKWNWTCGIPAKPFHLTYVSGAHHGSLGPTGTSESGYSQATFSSGTFTFSVNTPCTAWKLTGYRV